MTKLTGMSTQHTPSTLPALEEIRFITSQDPYVPLRLFRELRKLHIDMEALQIPSDLKWPSLFDLHLRGVIDLENLQSFLKKHKNIGKLHLAFVSVLRPLDSSGDFKRLLEEILNSRLDAELTGSIMRRAGKNADGHERSLIQHIYAQLDKLPNAQTVEQIRQLIITFFKTLLKYEFDKHSTEIGKMEVPLKNPSRLELSTSIEYFWEDELAIKGINRLEDYAPRKWVWTNNKVRTSLKMSCVFQHISPT
ncbi:hypothetical protein BDV29DRAFT_185574 [Aspergillus leporis]|uniref:Uncharacterized protein n=1 Tax=Aspergillus leporis TaxID=41062 RepID=A0A5N5WIY8_9EURO|nr:hypothetical protein BDV29DRAFT_185574 [Aspergillus leporis]